MKFRLNLILDTNVFVAACFGGHAAQIVQAWLGGHYRLVVSNAILDEYEHILHRHPVAQRQNERLSLWREAWQDARLTLHVEPTRHGPWCHDASDDKFIAAGLQGNAQALLTADHMLLTLVQIEGLAIRTARKFAEMPHDWKTHDLA